MPKRTARAGPSVSEPAGHYSARTRVILARARAEAGRLGHEAIGTEHLLLGVLVEDTGMTAAVLRAFGIDREIARHRVHESLEVGEAPASEPHALLMTMRAARVLTASALEAQAMGSPDVAPEHLLLALIREKRGVAGTLLADLGLTLRATRRQVRLTAKALRRVAEGKGRPAR